MTQEVQMTIEPGKSVGPLNFKMKDHEVSKIIGEEIRSLDMSHDRVMKVYSGDIDTAIFHNKHGLVSVSISSSPLMLNGKDLLTLDGNGIADLCREQGVEVKEILNGDTLGELHVSDWGLSVYLDNATPDSVEISIGKWNYGELIDIEE
jgi:hypothetical protein